MSLPEGLLRFVAVGVVSVTLDVGTLWLLHGVVGLALPLATALAFGCAFFVNFFVNRAWTFRRRDAGVMALGRYALLVLLNLALVEVGVLSLTGLGLDYRIARATCTAALVPLNFVVMRHWVFGRAPVTAS